MTRNQFLKFAIQRTSIASTVIGAVAALAMTLVAISGCTRQSGFKPFNLVQDPVGIFSTRPEPGTFGFYLVKLKQPPLLVSSSVATQQQMKTLIDQQIVEQDVLQKDLTALSSDIKTVYRYRWVINGIAIIAPRALEQKIGALAGVATLESAGHFERPVLPAATASSAPSGTLAANNSVKFIGADKLHAKGIRGQGMKVGIIDSGIDYTHSMFGGVGTEEAYKAIDPNSPTTAFPSAKVVGGIDLVGTMYHAGSTEFARQFPIVDANPIDESGHGSHVAGTVAGVGDGVNTYDGVAPDASLYAMKVFGSEGSTSDSVVIAALEYAADPNGDGDRSDHLDVVNLSLGSGYGSDHILYSQAIQNLSNSGTVVVCSAGNEGDEPYIVGSPGASNDAFSIAASIDNMDHNWRFRSVAFDTSTEKGIEAEAIEGTITKPLKEVSALSGSLFAVGLASEDLSEEVARALKGKVALIDRGGATFTEKISRAVAAGAIGVVMVNNQNAPPIPMGGDLKEPFPIPAVMITKDLGTKLKAELALGDVTVNFVTGHFIEKPELIDTITDFSSRGPRSVDGLLKPEIAAPGKNIVSAKVGGGAAPALMSGTSMSAPHMAGVMALLHQVQPTLSSAELKSMAMGTAKMIADAKGVGYGITRQGAGRIQVDQAAATRLIALPSAVSLGEVVVEAKKVMARTLELKNIGTNDATYTIALAQATGGLSMQGPTSVTLKPQEKKSIALRFTLAVDVDAAPAEASGVVSLSESGSQAIHVPVLAVIRPVTSVAVKDFVVRSTSELDSQGAVVDLTLKGTSRHSSDIYLFNLIGRDGRKEDSTLDQFRNRFCDLSEVGYRIVKRGGDSILQIGTKIFEPLTTWDLCEVSVLIDANGDHKADQELAGLKLNHIEGMTSTKFASVLMDVTKARGIRSDYQAKLLQPRTPDQAAPVLDFTDAIDQVSPMLVFNQSTVAIVEVPIAALKLKSNGTLAVRVATSAQVGSAIEPDDFLRADEKAWTKIDMHEGGASFFDLPEVVNVKAGQETSVSFTKGTGGEKLWLVQPAGRPIVGGVANNQQSEILKPKFQP